ncbi:MAG TPA: ferritin-like domain-containing protein [Telluria sp.]|nr:ferritin-like domain-containing protein [Telluria sp.]
MEREHMGMNRTGIQMSPNDAKAMQDIEPGVQEAGGEEARSRVCAAYIAEAGALGSVPLPATLRGAVATGSMLFKGENPQLLIDKLGERIAFERTGTRLYDALIAKCEVLLDDTISMTLDDLRRIRADEARHMALVADAVDTLGGDPTAVTPSGDLAGVESIGLIQVINDPRTSIAQCLHAILTAELSDRSGWEILIALADAHDLDDLVLQFSEALDAEREHVALVETWYAESIGLTYGDVTLGGAHDA